MHALAIYLNDHLAAATGAVGLVRRAANSNRGSEYGAFLERLTADIEQDRRSLLSIMNTLDVGVDRFKMFAGWGGEKLGRLKQNGRLFSYSPLSRLIELEGLTLAITAKAAMWRALKLAEPEHPDLAPFQLMQLLSRAERQLEELELHRLRAVTQIVS